MKGVKTENWLIGTPWLLLAISLVVVALAPGGTVSAGALLAGVFLLGIPLLLALWGARARRGGSFIGAGVVMFLVGAIYTFMGLFGAGVEGGTYWAMLWLAVASWATSPIAIVVGLVKRADDRRAAAQPGALRPN